MRYGLNALHTLRQNNIASEIFPELTKKINKQLEYADKKMIPYTIVIGDDETASGLLTLKNMKTGEQLKKTLEDIIKLVKTF
jgi:histidyl-tRNA synthetase